MGSRWGPDSHDLGWLAARLRCCQLSSWHCGMSRSSKVSSVLLQARCAPQWRRVRQPHIFWAFASARAASAAALLIGERHDGRRRRALLGLGGAGELLQLGGVRQRGGRRRRGAGSRRAAGHLAVGCGQVGLVAGGTSPALAAYGPLAGPFTVHPHSSPVGQDTQQTLVKQQARPCLSPPARPAAPPGRRRRRRRRAAPSWRRGGGGGRCSIGPG